MSAACSALPHSTCPLCGGPNDCAPAACGDLNVACWCRDVNFSAELLAQVPAEQQRKACICRRCATTLPPAQPQAIDLASYPRADILKAFVDRLMPQFSVTCEVDVTALKRACEAAQVSFFLGLSYAVTRAVNAIPALRHRMIDGVLYEYPRTDPGYTVAREGDLFSFCDGVYLEDFRAYCEEARARMEAVKTQPDLSVREKHHMFFISSVPWLSFTGFTHPYDPRYGYVPVLTLGKYVARGDALVMPVAIQVHHGTVDGVHVARFYEALNDTVQQAPNWMA
ncbi:MAG TPA: cysteine-rich CWC family protein [Aquabacterium sp.]|nr:cysteine-rich CWC family protein [Aquabacterium sp.]